ncbi:MAG: hypothetical protein E7359_03070 [Clostridiales bacterium]|nr:hypothetical protein [Clostridiales bacterium]
MLYFKFFKIHLKKLKEYRFSMFLSIFSQMLTCAVSLLTIYFLFDRFKIVDGWTFEQVAISYAVVQFCFSIIECFFRGIDEFPSLVKSGTLDSFLVRPRSIFSQALCHQVEFSKIGKTIVSLIILIYACLIQPFTFTPLKILVLISMVLCGIIIFLSLFMLAGAFSIFTIDGIETMNIFTYGGKEFCQYPINIYGKTFTKIFTFIIPFATFNYLPMMYLFNMPNTSIINIISPFIGMLFFIPCYLIFKWSLKRYMSTGS